MPEDIAAEHTFLIKLDVAFCGSRGREDIEASLEIVSHGVTMDEVEDL